MQRLDTTLTGPFAAFLLGPIPRAVVRSIYRCGVFAIRQKTLFPWTMQAKLVDDDQNGVGRFADLLGHGLTKQGAESLSGQTVIIKHLWRKRGNGGWDVADDST